VPPGPVSFFVRRAARATDFGGLAFFSATLVSDEADHADRYLPAGIDAPHAPPHGADAPPGQAPAQKGPKEGRNLVRVISAYN